MRGEISYRVRYPIQTTHSKLRHRTTFSFTEKISGKPQKKLLVLNVVSNTGIHARIKTETDGTHRVITTTPRTPYYCYLKTI